MSFINRMRAEWNQRAKQDAHFYVAFAKEQQDEASFRASAAETMPALEQEFRRLTEADPARRKALEIGCGPGRLMAPMAEHFGEVHGVDVSDEMLALARKRLANVPGARFHLVSGDNLAPIGDAAIDFVYSYTVFQHIPSREAVLNYLREAHRVLKPRGILRCQIRGTPPTPLEIKYSGDTWTGCYFTADEMAKFARAEKFPLLEITGIGTQYMWTTFQKVAANEATRDPLAAVLKGVTNANRGGTSVPRRGREAAVSLWIADMPGNADLASFPVYFNGIQQMGCYLSPMDADGACQLNARLPEGLAVGPAKVQLGYSGQPFGTAHEITVTPDPEVTPKILKIADAKDLTLRDRVSSGGLKIEIEGVREPERAVFFVNGKPPETLEPEPRDPITDTYEFSVVFPRKTPLGSAKIEIEIDGRPFHEFDIDVTGTWD